MQNLFTSTVTNPISLFLILGIILVIISLVSFFLGIFKNLIKFAIIGSFFLFITSLFFRFNLKTGKLLEDRCLQKGVAGSCLALIYKYEYNLLTKNCQEFLWGGCDGYVPFKSLEECQTICQN